MLRIAVGLMAIDNMPYQPQIGTDGRITFQPQPICVSYVNICGNTNS